MLKLFSSINPWFYRPEHMQRGLYTTEIWKYWNAKLKYTNEQSSKGRWENWGHLSGYHVYSQNYDHENAKSGSSSFVFSADDSKVSLKILTKYLGASERFDLVLSESAMECWILIVIRKLLILEDARC